MKKTVSVILLLALSLLAMTSCSLLESKTVTFVLGADYENDVVDVPPFATVTPPAVPEREGYTFDGWYSDYKCTEKADLNRIITEDTVFYAGWIPEGGTEVGNDGVDLTPDTPADIANLVAVKRLSSCVNIVISSVPTTYCGGVVIGETESAYYVLGGLSKTSYLGNYTVIDARGNEYEAKIVVRNPNTKLAFLRMPKGDGELTPVPLSDIADATDMTVVMVCPDDKNINVSYIERITGYTNNDGSEIERGIYTGADNEYAFGAPIFDKYGAIIGIHMSENADGDGSLFFTASEIVKYIEQTGNTHILGGAE